MCSFTLLCTIIEIPIKDMNKIHVYVIFLYTWCSKLLNGFYTIFEAQLQRPILNEENTAVIIKQNILETLNNKLSAFWSEMVLNKLLLNKTLKSYSHNALLVIRDFYYFHIKLTKIIFLNS